MNKEYIIECKYGKNGKWELFEDNFDDEKTVMKSLQFEKNRMKEINDFKWKFRILEREVSNWKVIMEDE